MSEVPCGMPANWFVVFYDTPHRYWWRPLCRAGFSHVLAFAYSASSGVWLVYDVAEDRSFVRAYDRDTFCQWMSALPDEKHILHVETAGWQRSPKIRLGFWCVPAVAHLLGIGGCALRPQALWRQLIALGATEANWDDQG